ncbi:MAG: hypothetical protein J2P26_05210 [Nocardiopsaceae bacterium]|nr:hypothetical protein [Nocardiopsaceae bacterium]
MSGNKGTDNPGGPDPLERLLNQQARPLPPPPGTFELITRRARRRKLRRTAVTLVSGAVVAAGVLVATMNPTLLRLTPPSESGQVVAGRDQPGTASPGIGTQQPNGSGAPVPSPSTGSSAANPRQPFPGPVPVDFAPASVTFVSPTRAWVIGQAGTPGSCYNGNICTSVAWTSDGGKTWHGQPAPVAGAPGGANGVSGIRFLDGVNGWAFGPELWSTHDAGGKWRAVDTFGQRVTDLEASGNRAYALFANCSGASAAGFAAHCTGYTLMTASAGSDDWVPVGSATSDLTGGGSAMLSLAGGAGYLVAPDGALYSGPIGGTWSPAGTAPCVPSSPQASGLPSNGQLASVSAGHLALLCGGSSAGAPPVIWTSADGGARWTRQAATAWTGVPQPGRPASLAAAPDGGLVLATANGLYVRPAGASKWQAATASGGSALPPGGFSYVGMTSGTRGAALPANPSLHEIWVTSDGGRTWTPEPISHP